MSGWIQHQADPTENAIFEAPMAAEEARRFLDADLSLATGSSGLRRRVCRMRQKLERQDVFDSGQQAEIRALALELEALSTLEVTKVWVPDEHHVHGGGVQDLVSEEWHALQNAKTALVASAKALAEVQFRLRTEKLAVQLRDRNERPGRTSRSSLPIKSCSEQAHTKGRTISESSLSQRHCHPANTHDTTAVTRGGSTTVKAVSV